MRPRSVFLIAGGIVAGLLVLTGLVARPGVLASNIATWIAASGRTHHPVNAEQTACRDGTGDAAIDACTQIIQSGSSNVYLITWAYNARGYRRQKAGELDKSIADLNEAIRRDPKFSVAYTNRGNTWMAKGEPDKALADFDAVVQLTPRSAKAHVNVGWALHKKGELEKANAEYDEAIRLDPSETQAYINRGIAWSTMGDLDKAIADEGMAIRLDPKSRAGYYNRGNALFKTGELDKAIADYSALLQIVPNQDHVFMERGLAWFGKSDYAQAQADFAQAGRLKPEYAYYAILAEVARQHGSSEAQLPDARLSDAMAHFDMAAWPAPIVRMFLGQATQASVLSAAESAPTGLVAGQVCEANFYAAEYAIGQGGRQDAIHLLRLAGTVCPKNFIESYLVPIELKRLGETP